MNGFLVSYGGTMDDFPCGFFGTEEEAAEFAGRLFAEVSDAHTGASKSLYDGPILKNVSDVFGRDITGFCVVSVTEFKNGLPADNDVLFGDDDLPDDDLPGLGLKIAETD